MLSLKKLLVGVYRIMAFKRSAVSLIVLSGVLLTGCASTTRTTTVYSTRPPVVTSKNKIITTTKAYKSYTPKYKHAPSQNVAIQQTSVINNSVVKNKYHTPAPYTTSHVAPHTSHYKKKHHTSNTHHYQKPSYPHQIPVAPYQYEQKQLEEAKRRSLQTKAEEDAWNQRLDAAEEHQMQQALMNSYETKAAEDATRAEAKKQESWLDSSSYNSQNNAVQDDPINTINHTSVDSYSATGEEERQMQQAIEASLQTEKNEELQRQNELRAEEERQMQQAVEASLQTKALEDSLHAQEPFSAAELQPVMAPEPQPILAPMEVAAPVYEQPAQEAAWVPNEGVQVQAGAKLMELKNQRGGAGQLSLNEMNTHLQKEMNLSEAQASSVLDELGIE